MARSRLQEPFVREIAATFRATQARIARRLAEVPPADPAAVVEDELRGLYHGLFVILDGGTALADDGLVSVVDEDGWRSIGSCTRRASHSGRRLQTLNEALQQTAGHDSFLRRQLSDVPPLLSGVVENVRGLVGASQHPRQFRLCPLDPFGTACSHSSHANTATGLGHTISQTFALLV